MPTVEVEAERLDLVRSLTAHQHQAIGGGVVVAPARHQESDCDQASQPEQPHSFRHSCLHLHDVYCEVRAHMPNRPLAGFLSLENAGNSTYLCIRNTQEEQCLPEHWNLLRGRKLPGVGPPTSDLGPHPFPSKCCRAEFSTART